MFTESLQERNILVFAAFLADVPEARQRIVPAIRAHVQLPQLVQLGNPVPFVRLPLPPFGAREIEVYVPHAVKLFNGFLPPLLFNSGAGFIVQFCNCLSPVEIAASRHDEGTMIRVPLLPMGAKS